MSNATLLFLGLCLFVAVAPGSAAPVQGDASDPISRIVVEGNERTALKMVLRVMNVREGDPLDAAGLDAVWDALEDCGWFSFVEIDDQHDDEGRRVLTVTVEEDMTTFYGPLVRYDRRHKYLLGGWVEERHLAGRGQTLRVEASAVYLRMASAEWRVPWLAGVDDLTGTLAVAGEQADFVFRPTRYRKMDANLKLRWDFAGPLFVQTGARYGRFSQRDNFSWTLPARGAGTSETPFQHLAAGEDHWRLAAGIGFDTRDNPFYPQRGTTLLAEAARWESNGYVGYSEASADARAFLPLPLGNHVMALHGWGRRLNGPAPLDNLLFLGGPETIRGQRFGSLEGDEGWLLSAEYRLPLFMMPIASGGESVGFGLHLFADAGQAWYRGAQAGEPVHGWGGGAHMNLDTWQLRFEGARDEAGNWHFEFMDRFNF